VVGILEPKDGRDGYNSKQNREHALGNSRRKRRSQSIPLDLEYCIRRSGGRVSALSR
jgi:hypothetical protein